MARLTIGYFRCSNENEAAEMEKKMKRLAAVGNHKIDRIVYDDVNSRRLCLSKLIHGIEGQNIGCLVMFNWRELGDYSLVREYRLLALKRNHVRVLSLDGQSVPSYPTTAEHYLIAVKEYNGLGNQFTHRYGISSCRPVFERKRGRVPIGYSHTKSHRIDINFDEKRVVEKAFELYADGKGVTEIANILSDSEGHGFSRNTIQTMLANRRYMGIDTGEFGLYPPLVPSKVWFRVSNFLKMNSRGGETNSDLRLFDSMWARDNNQKIRLLPGAYCGRRVFCGTIRFENGTKKTYMVDVETLCNIVLDLVEQAVNSGHNRLRRMMLNEIERKRDMYNDEYDNITSQWGHLLENTRRKLRDLRLDEELDVEAKDVILKRYNEICYDIYTYKHCVQFLHTKVELFNQDKHDIEAFVDRMLRLRDMSIFEQRFFMKVVVKNIIISNDELTVKMNTTFKRMSIKCEGLMRTFVCDCE